MKQVVVFAAAFVAFTAYTLSVMAGHGVFGFIELAWREAWGGQLFVDLLVMLVLFSVWLVGDCRARQRAAWPWIVLTMTMGSMGVLAYLVHRAWTARSATTTAVTTTTTTTTA